MSLELPPPPHTYIPAYIGKFAVPVPQRVKQDEGKWKGGSNYVNAI